MSGPGRSAAALSPLKQALLARRLRDRRDGGRTDRIPRRADPQLAPLGPAQEALFLREAMRPGLASYHQSVLCRLQGPLDVGCLEAAFDAVVRRHEALRTTFELRGDVPQQIVHDALPIGLERIDAGEFALEPGMREDELVRLVQARVAQPFDLGAGPLLRAALVRRSETEHLLLIVVHHIVFDGASGDILLRDLATAYEKKSRGEELDWTELSLQYGDVTAWQRAALSPDRLEVLRRYWSDQLAGVRGPLEIPTDRARRAVPSDQGASRRALFSPELQRALERLGTAHQATLHMVLVAAFQTLLHRYSRSDDILLGSPLAGRPRSEFERLIGNFVNTVVLRARFTEGLTFGDLLRQVRQTCLDAYDHQDVPPQTLVTSLAAESKGGGFCSVLFVLQHPGGTEPRFGDLLLEPIPLDTQSTAFELVLSMGERPDGLRATLQYQSELFEAATIDAMLEQLRVLLEAVTADPGSLIADLPLMTQTERRRLLVDLNATSLPTREDATLDQLFAEQAVRTPDALAVSDGAESLCYSELAARVEREAERIAGLGAGAGTVVGISAVRSVPLLVGLLSVMRAGAAYLPLEPSLPVERLRFMLRDAGVSLVLADLSGAFEAREPGVAVTSLEGSSDASGLAAGRLERSLAVADGVVNLIYTSGSTGTPKAVTMPHRALSNYFQWQQRAFPLGPGDVFLQRTAYSFDAAALSYFAPLIAGAALVLAPPGADADAYELVKIIRERGVTAIETPASLVRMLLDVPDFGLCTSLKAVFCGGERLAVDVCEQLTALLPVAVTNLYGPTEACIAATFHRYAAGETAGSVPIGRPIGNVQAYVLDRRLAPCPVGVPGELYLGGRGLALGYHARPELTARAFIPHPFEEPPARVYATGDLVRYRPDGTLDYLGRLDEQVKIRAYRVELGEVEAALLRHPAVHGAAVIVRPDGSGEPALAAFFVSSPGLAVESDAMREHLRRTLPPYMIPAALVRLDAFPLTASGKVDRRALAERNAFEEVASETVAQPRNSAEEAVMHIVAAVLGRERVDVERNFLDLGGHSLHAMRVVARIEKLFRIRLPIALFFERSSVRSLTLLLESREPAPGHVAATGRALAALQAMSPEERSRRRQLAQKAAAEPRS